MDRYCQNCFALVAAQIEICPWCGGDPVRLSAQDYLEKLLHALLHPLDDVRMRAIIALGLRHEAEAAFPLAECALRHPLNIEEGLEVIKALAYAGFISGDLSALEMLAGRHPAHAVREAAKNQLNEIVAQRTPK